VPEVLGNSTANLELVSSIGADRIIDYTEEDFTQNRETYDIILVAAGAMSFAHCKHSLNENGKRGHHCGT
jgi:NADPH2:quinone reductase